MTDTTIEEKSDLSINNSNNSLNAENFSKTNVQVEGVDEADIVKTDGNYIYYVTYSNVYIVDSKKLEVVYKFNYENYKDIQSDDNEGFCPSEIYINGDKLIILGTSYKYENVKQADKKQDMLINSIFINHKQKAQAIVYDITNRKNPKEIRKVELDGKYNNSRMIGENIYFISTKYQYYYDNIKDDDLLPVYQDTAVSNTDKVIAYNDIAYFKDTKNFRYMLVAGFNINNKEEVNVETFFGANNTVYSSQKNMYISQTIYKDGFSSSRIKSQIYKFNLDDSEVKLQGKAEIKGNLNNQFSMDEYEGNLRIATTDNSGEKSTNQLYILDENLNQIGSLENLAKDEKIYSVRFIGKIGYIVTFKQIDPLFVIDLSDPTNPQIKGKLKIPGYSSYLHPYDETHIIGIGYNTKSNEFGGVTNANMKMSMFDVSDLENPKELFHVNIGSDYTYSDIIYIHKVLFYNKEKNLIGFPMTWRENSASKDANGFVIYKINIDKGFAKYGEVKQKISYESNVDRIIYIRDTLYTLAETQILAYDLNTVKIINKLQFND